MLACLGGRAKMQGQMRGFMHTLAGKHKVAMTRSSTVGPLYVSLMPRVAEAGMSLRDQCTLALM